jgi:hypothetical protein
MQTRITAMEKFVSVLKTKRDIIVKVLMWEICKIQPDAGTFTYTYTYMCACVYMHMHTCTNANSKVDVLKAKRGIIVKVLM